MLANRYDMKDVIGAGGMGMVYLAEDTQTGQPVAVKLLKQEAVQHEPKVLERFLREGEALRALNHPNIVKMFEMVEKDDSHFIIMEYVSGGSLKSLMQREGRLPVDRALEISLDLCDALTRTHRLKIVHRDIKPANVLMAEDGTPRLADFGVAYFASKEPMTNEGMAMGTADYICPEALAGDTVDARADIWSLGILLFEMLAGRRPFSGDMPQKTLLAILTEVTPDLEELRPDIPVAVADLVYRMLEKDPNTRIPSIRLVGAEIEAILQGIQLDTSRLRPARFPAAAGSDAPTTNLQRVRNNLPAQTTEFVGREGELEEIARLLATPNNRLVTILAPGGMGKTRLSLEADERQMNDFADGVYFVSLAPLTNSEAIVPAIADALRYKFMDDGRTLRQQILDTLREKCALLVLDNFEHLLDGAALVSDILEAAPEVQVITTTRARLNLGSETILTLSGMEVPDWETTEHALEYNSVKLFMQSARREDPGFELQGSDLKHVARICRLLQGMPLGILLAASWVDTLSLAEIADEIAHSLDFLESDRRDLPTRHQSIRAVFEYSWSLLPEKERETFRRLSVFRGGMTRQAAQQVTGTSLRTLMALVDKSLLRRDPASGRSEVHELLRQYAAEQLTQVGEVETLRDAHAAYYTSAVGEREADIKGRRQLPALNEIESDFENVRAAWDWALERGNAEAIGQATESLALFFNMRSRWQSDGDLLLRAIERFAPLLGAAPGIIWARLLARYYHQYPDAAWLKKALEIARANADQREIAFCLFALGWVNYASASYEAALNSYEESLTLYQALGDEYYIAAIYSGLGVWYAGMGEVARGMSYSQQSLDVRRRLGDRVGMAEALQYLSAPLIFQGRLAEAERYTQEAHDISQETGSLSDIAFSGATLAGLALWRGDYNESRRLVEQALQIARDIHVESRRGFALAIQGMLAVAEGDYAHARALCEEARPLAAANPLIAYIADIGLATAAAGLGDYDTAKRITQTALETVLALNNLAFMAVCLPSAAAVLAHEGQQERAAELVSLAYHHATGWPSKWALLRTLRADLEQALDKTSFEAAWERGKALDLETVARELVNAQV